jgi:hypothetical protein
VAQVKLVPQSGSAALSRNAEATNTTGMKASRTNEAALNPVPESTRRPSVAAMEYAGAVADIPITVEEIMPSAPVRRPFPEQPPLPGPVPGSPQPWWPPVTPVLLLSQAARWRTPPVAPPAGPALCSWASIVTPGKGRNKAFRCSECKIMRIHLLHDRLSSGIEAKRDSSRFATWPQE